MLARGPPRARNVILTRTLAISGPLRSSRPRRQETTRANLARQLSGPLFSAVHYRPELGDIAFEKQNGFAARQTARCDWFALTVHSWASQRCHFGSLHSAGLSRHQPVACGFLPLANRGLSLSKSPTFGAILTPRLGFRVEVLLPRFRPMPYDGAVTDGTALLLMSKLDEPSINQCSSILSAAGQVVLNRLASVSSSVPDRI